MVLDMTTLHGEKAHLRGHLRVQDHYASAYFYMAKKVYFVVPDS